MRSVLVCAVVLAWVIDQESAEAAECTEAIFQESGPSRGDQRPEPSRTIGRLGMGAQFGGFYDLGDPALELRAWAKRMGFSISLGRHVAEPRESGLTEVYSYAGKQVTGGFLFAFRSNTGRVTVHLKKFGSLLGVIPGRP